MYVLVLTMFLAALDQSIVATAIPHVVADLGGFKLLPWVFTVYVLSSTVVIPPNGKLTDMFGRTTGGASSGGGGQRHGQAAAAAMPLSAYHLQDSGSCRDRSVEVGTVL